MHVLTVDDLKKRHEAALPEREAALGGTTFLQRVEGFSTSSTWRSGDRTPRAGDVIDAREGIGVFLPDLVDICACRLILCDRVTGPLHAHLRTNMRLT